jgi:threonine synthase
MACIIFVPRNAAAPKLAQLLVYGATVFSVAGHYDDAYRLCSAACERFGWYNRNCAINPVLVEGKKTCGLEIAEQSALADDLPDWVVVSIGDGCTIAGIAKGLAEMQALGVIQRMPRILGVQAAGVAPVEYALKHDQLPAVSNGTTIADGINVQVPRNWRKAVRAIRAAEGTIVNVSDEEMLMALARAGRHGVFGEPAAAAGIAGVKVAVERGIIRRDESVLAVNTGSGLKDTSSAMKAVGKPLQIEADLDQVAAQFGRRA